MIDVLLAILVSILTIGLTAIACLTFIFGTLALIKEIQRVWKDIRRNKKF